MKIYIVDDQDRVIGTKERNSILKDDVYRVSGLWITNSKNEILLARRSHLKHHDPGKWGPAVAGTVEENETYQENIIKEAKEELGITDLKLSIGPKIRVADNHNYFVQWFFGVLDQDSASFKLDKSEVEEVKWISKEDLIDDFEKNRKSYLNSAHLWINNFLKF